MKYCKNCGAEIEENASFCGNCGKAVDESYQEITVSYENKNQTQTEDKQNAGLNLVSFL